MINSMAAFGSFNEGPSVHDRVAELEAENKKLREQLESLKWPNCQEDLAPDEENK